MSQRDFAAARPAALARLLDPAMGFFVWAAHFLALYVAAALACVLGLGSASPNLQTAFLGVLGLVTIAAAAGLLLHGVLRYRKYRNAEDRRFVLMLTLGGDALSGLAIVLQFFPIFLVPLCV